MSNTRFSLWTYVTVALTLAVAGFLAGQLFDSAGVPIVAGGALLWTAYNARRFGKVIDHHG